ncbi:MAG: NUDIX domain-containing protein [Patescibacteria group bacterium]|nr:NUDIX domain-containing protein [Patescibacteria group bacterium]
MKQNNKFPRGIEVVTAAVIRNKEGKILLVKSSSKWNKKYVFPGGHIDPGETIENATKREALEETGLKIKTLEIITSGELINPKDFFRPVHFIYIHLLCEILGGKIKLDGRELDDYIWVMPEKAIKMNMEETSKETVREYIKKFKSKN